MMNMWNMNEINCQSQRRKCLHPESIYVAFQTGAFQVKRAVSLIHVARRDWLHGLLTQESCKHTDTWIKHAFALKYLGFLMFFIQFPAHEQFSTEINKWYIIRSVFSSTTTILTWLNLTLTNKSRSTQRSFNNQS